ncbi:MAG: sugar phosphate isomerase/epimerase [Verrucomicrobiaceae bacterium]|nr:sugar phosphate isomerase/epimerase [Verrucomicrobiaceae bacterium]
MHFASELAEPDLDEEIEFSFLVAKALGCTGVTTERNAILAARVAPFADKHKIWVGLHNHTNNLPDIDKFDFILDLGQYIGFNLDIGHYVAGTKGKSPIPVLEKYHDRITNLHLKDRTAEVELEYKIPEGSTAVAEVKKCV